MDKSREQFEEWFHSRYDQIKMTDHERLMLKTNQWAAWQASRSTIEIELPYYCEGYVHDPELINTIKSQGLKVRK